MGGFEPFGTTVLRLLRLPGGARHFEAVGQDKAVACQNGHAAVGPAYSEATLAKALNVLYKKLRRKNSFFTLLPWDELRLI